MTGFEAAIIPILQGAATAATGALVSNIAQKSLGGKEPSPAPSPVSQAEPLPIEEEFEPERPEEMQKPSTLAGMGDLSGQQFATALATKGAFGGGLGPQEKEYYLTQLQRRIIDPSGGVSDLSGLAPVETSYLESQGLPTGGAMDLLRAIQGG